MRATANGLLMSYIILLVAINLSIKRLTYLFSSCKVKTLKRVHFQSIFDVVHRQVQAVL